MPLSRFRLSHIVLMQEIRTVLVSPALWIMLIILSLLVGYSFIQAVDLFSAASSTALTYPELASGMNPMEGVFVPTYGAYYLVDTLLLPFVAIRLIGQDKQNGTLKLLLQLPLTPFSLNAIKLTAMAVVWVLVLVPGVSTMFIWQQAGGVIHLPALATLLMGHTLYALVVVCFAMFAASVSNALPTAAMLCLAATLGSWVLDFTVNDGGWLGRLSNWSVTALLRQFESGLLTSVSVVVLLALSLLFFIAASVWLHPGLRSGRKLVILSGGVIFIAIMVSAVTSKPLYLDVTESRKHSFNPADTHALQKMNKPLLMKIHLSPEDSRLYDLEHDVLAKLRRTVPDLEVVYVRTQSAGLFGAAENDDYGLVEYEYEGKVSSSYSNSAFEILPLLHALADHEVVPDATPGYAGQPLVADVSSSKWWFYLILPLVFLLGAYFVRQPQLSVTHARGATP